MYQFDTRTSTDQISTILNLNLGTLEALADPKTEIGRLIRSEYVLEQLANKYGLPISRDFDLLLHYSRMRPQRLLNHAAFGNDIRVVRAVIDREPNLNYKIPMARAAAGGAFEIVKLMIELGADNYFEAMIAAARSGSIEIVEFMIKYIPKSDRELVKYDDDYNQILGLAARNGKLDLLKMVLAGGSTDYDYAISEAFEGKHPEIAEFVLGLTQVPEGL